jgi:hypothetical protein
MDSCCQDKSCELEALRGSQSRPLWMVLGINGGMFGLELIIGLVAGSTALLADSLDMLGDALVDHPGAERVPELMRGHANREAGLVVQADLVLRDVEPDTERPGHLRGDVPHREPLGKQALTELFSSCLGTGGHARPLDGL